MTGVRNPYEDGRDTDPPLAEQFEAMDKLRVSGEPGRLVVDAGELVTSDCEPRYWHLVAGEHAGTWIHAGSGTCGPLTDMLRGIAGSYLEAPVRAAVPATSPRRPAVGRGPTNPPTSSPSTAVEQWPQLESLWAHAAAIDKALNHQQLGPAARGGHARCGGHVPSQEDR
jgi:hypothetical protein